MDLNLSIKKILYKKIPQKQKTQGATRFGALEYLLKDKNNYVNANNQKTTNHSQKSHLQIKQP